MVQWFIWIITLSACCFYELKLWIEGQWKMENTLFGLTEMKKIPYFYPTIHYLSRIIF